MFIVFFFSLLSVVCCCYASSLSASTRARACSHTPNKSYNQRHNHPNAFFLPRRPFRKYLSFYPPRAEATRAAEVGFFLVLSLVQWSRVFRIVKEQMDKNQVCVSVENKTNGSETVRPRHSTTNKLPFLVSFCRAHLCEVQWNDSRKNIYD